MVFFCRNVVRADQCHDALGPSLDRPPISLCGFPRPLRKLALLVQEAGTWLLSMKVVVIAEDQESLQHCVARGEVEVRAGNTLQDANADTDYESGSYKQVVSKRAGYILSLFESQSRIIYSDVDTVWLRDPRPYLTGHYDVWMSVDEVNPLTLCTGFMALLPTASTLSVLRAWHDELTRQSQLNQPLFNRLLDRHPVRVGRLDMIF